jgi:hypothetical protein
MPEKQMKVGDLVKVKECEQLYDVSHPFYEACECFFCTGASNRVGMVLCPAQRNSWAVMFDCGERLFDAFDEARGEVKVINEIRGEIK